MFGSRKVNHEKSLLQQIDPSIPLSGKPAVAPAFGQSMQAGLGMAKTMQDIATSKSAQANIEAQTQGINSDSATKARTLAAQQWAGINMPDFLENTAPATGLSATGAPPRINHAKMMAAAKDAGFADLVPAIAKQYTDSTTADINSANTQQDLNERRYKAGQTAAGVVAQYVAAAPANKQMSAYEAARNHALEQFGPDVVNNNIPMQPQDLGQWIKSTAASSMTEKDKQDLSNTRAQIAVAQQQVGNQTKQLNMDSTQQLVKGAAEGNLAGTYQNGANTYDKLGLNSVMFKNMPEAAIAKYMSTTPDLVAAQQSLNQYNTEHPGKTPVNIGTPGVGDLLRQSAKTHNVLSNAWINTAHAGLGGKDFTGNVPKATAPQAISGAQAPAAAIMHLRQNPALAPAFKAKYGYLP